MSKKLTAAIYLRDQKAVSSLQEDAVYGDGEVLDLARHYSNHGADLILIFDRSRPGTDERADAEHDRALTLEREIGRAIDLPFWGLGNIKRLEDVKKILYTGARKAILNLSKASNRAMLKEAADRFGKDKLGVCMAPARDLALTEADKEAVRACASVILVLTDGVDGESGLLKKSDRAYLEGLEDLPILLCLQETRAGAGQGESEPSDKDLAEAGQGRLQTGRGQLQTDEDRGRMARGQVLTDKARAALLQNPSLAGICEDLLRDPQTDLVGLKEGLKAAGADVFLSDPALPWEDLKKDPQGLVTCVVQDFRTGEVLMVAYMNQEAYERTVKTGIMTYWSRSRKDLWIKGETSGHYQYLKELRVDCDQDTLLARVDQVGAACHTGNRSCFYRTLYQRETGNRNPMQVLTDVYGVISDRKVHPKEGSYTNYLFEKGIDKILKKCGEEATEIVIAAKNPNPEEVRYEMADFLYHMMVLMAEKGLTWEDLAEELANRK